MVVDEPEVTARAAPSPTRLPDLPPGRPTKRGRPGELHANAVLTWQAVREIRASTESGAVLARRYGVQRNQIFRVKRREVWRHVP